MPAKPEIPSNCASLIARSAAPPRVQPNAAAEARPSGHERSQAARGPEARASAARPATLIRAKDVSPYPPRQAAYPHPTACKKYPSPPRALQPLPPPDCGRRRRQTGRAPRARFRARSPWDRTESFLSVSAPASSSCVTMSRWPVYAAQMRAVLTPCVAKVGQGGRRCSGGTDPPAQPQQGRREDPDAGWKTGQRVGYNPPSRNPPSRARPADPVSAGCCIDRSKRGTAARADARLWRRRPEAQARTGISRKQMRAETRSGQTRFPGPRGRAAPPPQRHYTLYTMLDAWRPEAGAATACCKRPSHPKPPKTAQGTKPIQESAPGA